MTRVYLDHAATTPMVPAAVAAMTEQFGRLGNASSLHGSGRAARRVVEEAREAIAAAWGARSSEVVFTGGASEADNLAVKGAYWSGRQRGRTRLVCSTVEHHAVLDPVAWLGSEGADVAYAPVDGRGLLDLDAFTDLVDDTTSLVSVITAINEVGTVQPIADVTQIGHQHGALVHTDATQAVGPYGLDFAASDLDLVSVSAHKLGGPYGIGALLARRDAALTPLLHGGGQERELRSGTVDVASVAGFAAAVIAAGERRDSEMARLRDLRAQLTDGVRAAVTDVVVYGPPEESDRLPGLVTLGFANCSAEALLLLLDAAGIDASTGSACSAGVSQPSHVLTAMGVDPTAARQGLRLSLGHSSTPADVDRLLEALPDAVARARLVS